MRTDQFFRMIAVGFLGLGLSACALLSMRDPRSGYGYESAPVETTMDLYRERDRHQESQAREEMGLQGRPLTENEQQMLEERLRLKRLESRLASKREKKQYYTVKSQLRSDRERAYFLQLPTYEARERWARNRGLLVNEETYSDETASLIESNDIAIGMSQKAVLESWGDPDLIEVAGDPVYGNESWKYNRYVSNNDGYQKELRVIYFEGGRVIGWERL